MGALGVGVGLVTAGRRADAAESVAPTRRPARTIVDSQVHIWRVDLPNVMKAPAHLPRPFGYEELRLLMNEAGVDRAILVPPPWDGFRDDFVLEAARKYPDRFGAISLIDFERPRPPAALARWREQLGLLGARVGVPDDRAGALTDGTLDWFWKAASQYGMPVMAIASGQAAQYREVIRRYPDLILIIDHMGLTIPLVQAGHIEAAMQDVLSYARHPNVSVKLSSTADKSREPYPFRDMAPYIRRVFEAFGPRRCYWGTDLTKTIAAGACTYRQRITHFTEALEFLSEDDKDWVMGRAIQARLNWA